MDFSILKVGISSEQDVVAVRQRARQVCALLGCSVQDQVRVATAVSEVARCAFNAVTGGRAWFTCGDRNGKPHLIVMIRGTGGALRELESATPLGATSEPQLEAALVTAHRLMDVCAVSHEAEGATTVTLQKSLPNGLTTVQLNELVGQLSTSPLTNSYSEMQRQNQELVSTLAELRERQDDLLALTRELEDTNRGVVALYAEIEEKADRIRKADDMKSRFLSNTSHELRTPLSSIRAISKLLLDRMDGELTQEQERQVQFIAAAANDLSELVNDLLDLAKIEAGKVHLENAPIIVADLFSALKGMLRPLADNPDVELVFELPEAGLTFTSDEGKIGQLLRNFVSNALKFTEKGEVRVKATAGLDGQTIRIAVSDTGIGIAPENLALVFEEFGQVENHLQRKVKGTGLGLPLCRKLAALLGGHIDVSSEVGKGSLFVLALPLTPKDLTDGETTQPEPGQAQVTDNTAQAGTAPAPSAATLH